MPRQTKSAWSRPGHAPKNTWLLPVATQARSNSKDAKRSMYFYRVVKIHPCCYRYSLVSRFDYSKRRGRLQEKAVAAAWSFNELKNYEQTSPSASLRASVATLAWQSASPGGQLCNGNRANPTRPGGRTDCHTSDIGHWFAMTGLTFSPLFTVRSLVQLPCNGC